MRKAIYLFLVLSLLVSGCSLQRAGLSAAPITAQAKAPAAAPTVTAPAPKATPTAVPTAAPTAASTESKKDASVDVGPDTFPAGVNPLTGLPVKNPDALKIPPALVSITNFPPSARPQAGLSFSPVVYEMYIGEGTSRFLAVFYGDYPTLADAKDKEQSKNPAVGPVRSGRKPYEALRKLYNGFLVMASAAEKIARQLNYVTNVFGSDSDDINSAMVDVTRLEEVARAEQKRLGDTQLSGQRYATTPPEGGKAGTVLWLPWSFLNQVFWRYDEKTGGYHRWQDNADGSTFTEMTDRLTDEPLSFENVVVLFADHHAEAETVIGIDFLYITKMPAVVFRDGQMYEVFWSTRNETYEKTTGKIRPIRFVDAQGKPFPLKPGQTWVMVIGRGIQYNETVDSTAYYDLKKKTQPGSGIWTFHYYAPPVETP